MITAGERSRLLKIAAADGVTFVDLVRVSGLDPATSFRGADLRGVDFAGSDLRGFDFTDADLREASFHGATVVGATFDVGFRHIQGHVPLGSEAVPDRRWRPLTPFQLDVLNHLVSAVRDRGRALALMPIGTGRSSVVCELLAKMMKGGDRAAVIVSSAAERDQMLTILHERLLDVRVLSSKEAANMPGWTGIVVHSASVYDRGYGHLSLAVGRNLDLVVSTSLERLHDFLRVAEGTFDYVPTVAIDTPLLVSRTPADERASTLAKKMFGGPTVLLTVEEAVASGVLLPARLFQPFEPRSFPSARTMFTAAAERAQPCDLRQALDPVAGDLVQVARHMDMLPLLILSRDVHQARMMQTLLEERLQVNGGGVRWVSQRWHAGRIAHDLQERGGVIVAATSRQSIDAARLVASVAVATPLRSAAAQEIAYRSPQPFRDGPYPTVIDLAGAFHGFPGLQYGLPS